MFQLYKGKIILDKNKIPEIESIHKIIEKLPEESATKILMYIFLVYNRGDENPLKDFHVTERKQRAKDIAFGSVKDSLESLFPKFTSMIATAITDYEQETTDDIQKQIDLSDTKMYEFMKLLNENKAMIIKNTHEITGKVSFSTNIDIITSILDNSIEIIMEKAALMNLKQTGNYSHALRGGLSLKKKVNKLIRNIDANSTDT